MIEFLRLSWGYFAAPAASFFLDAQKEANGPGHLLLALRANSPRRRWGTAQDERSALIFVFPPAPLLTRAPIRQV